MTATQERRNETPGQPTQPYVAVGHPTADITVGINYRIIDLFSGSLYSSPNKALEELVANSYDADASHVDVFMPSNFSADTAAIWVIDDGESMDLDGLRDLWQIARSTKRQRPETRRKRIGKFGIGKLATYVLARRLTYICKRSGTVLAVTMNYAEIDQGASATDDETKVVLGVRELVGEELEQAIAPLRAFDGGSDVAESLVGSSDTATWTVAVMSDLRPAASGVKHGRVRWLLSTALPMNETFTLSINSRIVEPALETRDRVASWQVGERTPERLPHTVTITSDADGPYVSVDGIDGPIRGYVELFEDVLDEGKAYELGRSHGFFVKVRGRLINLDDPLFGLAPLSHATFPRFRMVIEVDGLDESLTAGREAIQQTSGLGHLRKYMAAEFNTARKIWDTLVAERDHEARLSTRIGRTSTALSRRPLITAVHALLTGSIDSLTLIESPAGVEDHDAFLDEMQVALEAGDSLIDDVVLAPLGIDRPIASYDPVSRTASINTLHPFFGNFVETSKSRLPFEMVAITDILTEAYLVEEQIPVEQIHRIMLKRDLFLRELVSTNREGPATIAHNLLAQVDDADGLEDAAADAFRSLGYQVTPIGGSGKPDGLAMATVGARQLGAASESYSFTYDAKSTGKKRVTTEHVHASGLARHRDHANATFAVVVGRDFEGDGTRASNLGVECEAAGITPIRATDLAMLVRIAAVRPVSHVKLRDWLEGCRAPNESRVWVRSLYEQEDEKPPLKDLLEVIQELQAQRGDVADVSNIKATLRLTRDVELSRERVHELLVGLKQMAGSFMYYDGSVVTVDTSIDRVIQEIARHQNELPDDVIRLSYLDVLWTDDESDSS